MNNRMKKRLLVSVLAGSCCGLLFGYDIGAISSATPELRKHFALSAPALGIAVSSALFGTIAGSVVAGFVADAIDRRGTLLVSGFMYVIASLGAAFAPGFAQFAMFRFVGGIAIGLISVATPMYLAEIAPAHLRGRLVGSFQINISIGVVLGFALGYFFSFPTRCGRAILVGVWSCSRALVRGFAPPGRSKPALARTEASLRRGAGLPCRSGLSRSGDRSRAPGRFSP